MNPTGDQGCIVSRLRGWARTQPGAPAYTFLAGGERPSASLTYLELDQRAAAIARALRRELEPDARLLLLYEPGLEFIQALWGCLYAGVVPVPASAPDSSALLQRTLPRLQAISRDCGASAILTSDELLTSAKELSSYLPAESPVRWLSTGTLSSGGGGEGETPEAPWPAEKLAILQYTSGSTGAPRGVVVTHGNLFSNQRMILEAMPAQPGVADCVVGWLPMYHDMGLIGNVLNSVFRGGQLVLMSPMDFIRRPVRWLRAITEHKGTISGGPNFAFDLCVQRISPEDLRTLDLRSWRVAFSGAEPVRASSLEKFSAMFQAAGFDPASLIPVYGLAEATLLASGVSRAGRQPPAIRGFSEQALGQNEVRADGSERAARLVGCGEAPEGADIAIVDPERRTRLPAGRVGE